MVKVKSGHWIALALFLFVGLLIGLQVKEHMSEQDPKVNQIKNRIMSVHPDIKNVRFRKGDKSYTLNKEIVYLCTEGSDGTKYDDNMLTYVALHEIAHTLCDEVGHTDKFYEIFERLLAIATQQGIYNPSIPLVTNYCK